ncbi:MAG: hypothetical protein LBH06_00825 [Rikenellaceae bacterium]|nr:hypothetical protein [Rikenellaceae bacterium]
MYIKDALRDAPVGSVVEYYEKRLKVVAADSSCLGCVFGGMVDGWRKCRNSINCKGYNRVDHAEVIFVELPEEPQPTAQSPAPAPGRFDRLELWAFMVLFYVSTLACAGLLFAAVRFSSFGHLLFAGGAFAMAAMLRQEMHDARKRGDGRDDK